MTEFTDTDGFAIYLDSETILFFHSFEEAKDARERLQCGGIITGTKRRDGMKMWVENMELPGRVTMRPSQPLWIDIIINHADLSIELKNILLNKLMIPFRYELDIGEHMILYDNMIDLQKTRDDGFGVSIAFLDNEEKRFPLTKSEEMAIYQCELSVVDGIDPYFGVYSDEEKRHQIENRYLEASESNDEKMKRETALELINLMSEEEFSDRLQNGYLPEFQRKISTIKRTVCESHEELYEEQPLEMVVTKYTMRMELEYCSIEEFCSRYEN